MPVKLQPTSFTMQEGVAIPKDPATESAFTRLQNAIILTAARRKRDLPGFVVDAKIGPATATAARIVLTDLTKAEYARLPKVLLDLEQYMSREDVAKHPQLAVTTLAAGAIPLAAAFEKFASRAARWALYIGGGAVVLLGSWLLLRKKG